MRPLIRLLAAAAIGMAACSPAAPTAVPPPPSPAGSPSPSAAASGPRPIVITTDLAGDDLMAVMAMLREPAVDVRAIAVDGNGEVHCREGLDNMRRLLGAFERSEVPIGCGSEDPGANGRLFPAEWRAGADAFYGVQLPAAAGTSLGVPAPQLIAEAVGASAGRVTVVSLGTWTSLAEALAADPSLPGRIAGIHAMAGAIDVPGNIAVGDVTPGHGVEWNVGVDPDAFAEVLALDAPVTLVPLDATNDVPVPADFAELLEADHAAAGADIAFEMFARSPTLTVETSFWDTLAVMALVDHTVVTWEDLPVRVERTGPSAGRIIRDAGGRPIRAAMSADRERFMAALLAALRRGGPRPEPFVVTGTLAATWNGAGCEVAASPPARPGVVRVEFANESATDAGLFLARVHAPKTWADAIALIRTIELDGPEPQLPDWLVPVEGAVFAGPGQEATAFVTLPAAEVGVVCATGEFPDLDFFDGGSFTIR